MLNKTKSWQLSKVMNHLHFLGVYVFESDVYGYAMAFWSNHLVILNVKWQIAIEFERIPDFTRWLKSIDKTGYLPLNLPYTFGISNHKLKIYYGENGYIEIWLKQLHQIIEEIEGLYHNWIDFKRLDIKGA